MRIDRRLLGWGAFFVIAGAIPLLVRGGLIADDALDGWPSLWPLLLIGGGLGLVLRRTPLEFVGGTISVITAGVMAGGLITSGFGGIPAVGGCGSGSGATAFPEQRGSFADRGSVSVEFNCGTLDVRAADGEAWALSGSGPADHQPVATATASSVKLAWPDDLRFGFMDAKSTWHVAVPRAVPVDLSVTLNAGEGTVDLPGTQLEAFNLTLNAGSLHADLSAASGAPSVNATLNAGSARVSLPADVGSTNLTMNAGSLTACVPAGTPVRVSWGGALASNNFGDVGLVKVDDNHWITNGLGASTPAANFNVSANAGSFKLLIGGSCNA
jgi:hypothetical protein